MRRERGRDREANQPERRKHIGLGGDERAFGNRVAIPVPGARVVSRCLVRAADLALVGVEEQVVVDRRHVLRRLDPAIRVFDARGRQLSLNLDVRVDPPRLPERPVLQRDIDADDPLAVHQDRQ